MRTLITSIIAASFLASCGDHPVSVHIHDQLKAYPSGPVSFQNVGPAGWDRVCFLHPYTTNARAAEILGLPWDAQGNTSIGSNDGINVIVFIKDNAVVGHIEHPRSQGDFAEIDPRCLARHQSVLVRQENGWRQQ